MQITVPAGSRLRAGAGLAVKVSGLRKSFGGKTVLDGVDLEIPEGRSSRCSAPRCAGLTALGYLWARARYNRIPAC